MALPLEDYALLGDTQTAALVGKDGSIDWACFPRFDSDACFAALLGDERHGHWRLAPVAPVISVHRRYLPGTLILETTFTTEEGVARLVDFMPIRGRAPDIVRIATGLKGQVAFHMELVVRPGYGAIRPYMRQGSGTRTYLAGPDVLYLRSPVGLEADHADFAVVAGQRISFALTWDASFRRAPAALDPDLALQETEGWWRRWSQACTFRGEFREDVIQSLVVLKALTYEPTGAIIAAPTASLPEALGGERNWDYRFCWIRDATFTLQALLVGGYRQEATAWRDWLVRAIGGEASQLRILFGAGGERWIPERTADWLPGYQGARPVRIGNGAQSQLQLDVFGELMNALHQARKEGLPADEAVQVLQRGLLEFLESHWENPDHGIWEMRGNPRPFTYSKVMAWAAVDRGIRSAEQIGLGGPVEHWRELRDRIHREVCDRGYDASRGTFVQSYGSRALDAALLRIPLVGFLPPHDPRFRGTVQAVERELLDEGLVRRYESATQDGFSGREGAFLACSFWLVDDYVLTGRERAARELFMRLLALRNDVGLLSEEYDTGARRLVGNFPQAFSHVALVNSAHMLATHKAWADS